MTEQHPTTARRLPKRALALAVAIAAVASALVFMTRSEGTPQREKREALVPVKVAVAEQKAVPFQLQAVGTVEAFATVSIKSRIDGQLVEITPGRVRTSRRATCFSRSIRGPTNRP